MSDLREDYYESGNAPHEALGRAARKLRGGGAIYLGAGIGAERQQTQQGETYHVSQVGAKTTTVQGPLSAVIHAFTLAGASTAPDSPGGGVAVKDPAAAARLRELADEEAEARQRIDRYKRQLAAKAARPWSPTKASDDWETSRIEELTADLRSIAAERARLLASGTVAESAVADLGRLAEAGFAPAIELFGLEEAFAETDHPRGFHGRFKAKLEGLAVGVSAKAPGGVTVKRTEGGFEVAGGGALSGHTRVPVEKLSSPGHAASLATARSLRSKDPGSLGGATHFPTLDAYEAKHGKPGKAPAGRRKALASDPRSTEPAAGAIVRGRKTYLPGDPGYDRLNKIVGPPEKGSPAEIAMRPERVISYQDAYREVAETGHPAYPRTSADELERRLDRGAKVRHRVVSQAEWAAMEKKRGQEREAAKAKAGSDPIERFSAEVASVTAAAKARYARLLDAVRKQAAVIDKGYHPNMDHIAHFVPDVKQPELSQLVRLGALVAVRQDGRTSYRLATPAEALKARRRQLAKMQAEPLVPMREAFSAPAGGGAPAVRDALKRTGGKGKAKPQSTSTGGAAYDEAKHKRAAAGATGGGRFVTKGSTGEDVRAVQHRVGASPDGKFGAKTREAVMEFQRRHGLQVDGVIGHQTAVALAGNYTAAKAVKVGALKDSDRAKLKALRKGGASRRPRSRRARGGVTV